MQATVGVAERMETLGQKVIRDYMPDQHRDFFAQLPFVVLGAVDEAGDAWATLIAGGPGFMRSPDPQILEFAVVPDPRDPAVAGLGDSSAIGLLGIEFHTRRRNRMNGRVHKNGAGQFAVRVEHAFGNCPQFIQPRDCQLVRDPARFSAAPARNLDPADPKVRAAITAADTFFVASYFDDVAGRHVDVSHRGGKQGFVRINPDGSLTIPDFAGNLHFNTLGNILVNPHAGLVFPDFETGALLQLTGDAEVVLDSPEISAFDGAERLWTFRPRRAVVREEALPLRFHSQPQGSSPDSLMTRDGQAARQRLDAEELSGNWRPFRVARIVEESSTIRSLHLEPADNEGIIAHASGQYLPIRVLPEPGKDPVVRTYSLSSAPSDGFYRLSVKRQGRASNLLHGLATGDRIEVRAPAGDFTIEPLEPRPAVMLAAGIGITPILAMLRTLVSEGLRHRHVRPTYVFVAARTLAERAFDREISELVQSANGAIRLVRVLGDPQGAEPGIDYEATGRIDLALLRSVLPFDGYDFYMCGPPSFMQGIYDQLRDLGIPDERIHAEAFGPASLERRHDQAAPAAAPAAAGPVDVVFMKSGKEARWQPRGGSLLELAEARGLVPEFSCRNGSCGTCATRIIAGRVAYPKRPAAGVADQHALICCAVPAAQEEKASNSLVLDL
ncbi:pyridoxamine 5'-phosphate oxidase family protein [Porphyrobacter sp. ULC335]|nr:pyridoxamine 5'-phosphate oxidase family protein [Porphyrobacter sp. ULC335]